MSVQLSICMPYHNNGDMLAYQRAEWAALPRWVVGAIEIVIVDDASKEPISYGAPDVSERLFRIDPPHVPWTHRCATNIAAHEARGHWLLLTDIDHVAPNEMLQELVGVTRHIDTERVYTFMRRTADGKPTKPHPDSWLIHRKLWHRIGGWDERYRGLYGQNARHWERVRHFAGEPVPLPFELVVITREQVPDASSPDEFYADRVRHKERVHLLRRQFRYLGTFNDSHQLTVPYKALHRA